MQVVLIRHAESEANQKPDLICGRTISTPLSKKGETQANQLGKKLKDMYGDIENIHCSSALRTQQTATLAFGETIKIIVTDSLLEQSAGIYEGTSRKDSYTPEILDKMTKQHVDFQPPEGESIRQAGQRLLDYIFELKRSEIKGKEHKNNRVVIVSHSMAIKGLLYHTVQLRPDSLYLTGCDNASITELHHDSERGWYLVRLNT